MRKSLKQKECHLFLIDVDWRCFFVVSRRLRR